ncbi:hypothetical protein JCM11491_001314 [Sporobolomyces phaffii]
MSAIPTLRLISEQILRNHWIHVRDVGDCPYQVVANLLKLSSANQLAEIEERSPHLAPLTNDIWKDLCVNDFVEVRKLVEDGKLVHPQTTDGSWKSRYYQEEEHKQAKMKLVLEKLRGQYNELDERKQSRQVQSIDGLRLEKRRKLLTGGTASSSRPKSLLQKARHNTKAITSIYTPKRKPVQAPGARTVPALAAAFPSSRRPAPKPSPAVTATSSRDLNPPPLETRSNAPSPSAAAPTLATTVDLAARQRPAIKTVTRTTTKRSSALISATSPPPSSGSSRHTSFSPPPSSSSFVVPPARPIAQIPLRSRFPAAPLSPPATVHCAPTSAKLPPKSRTSPQSSPPPCSAVSTPKLPPPPQRRPTASKGGAALFIPKKR